MKKIIIIAIMVVTIAVAIGVMAARIITTSNNDDAKLFGIVPVSEQDARLCKNSYLNGGKYYHLITSNVSLTCERHHVVIDYHSSEE